MIDTWICHVCGEERSDACISVHTRDISADHKLQPGMMKQNVRYCNDNKECAEAAKTYNILKKEEE